MKIHLNGNEVDCEAYSLSYGGVDEDLLNGVLINMPQHYIFLSDHVESHRELMEDLPDDIEHFDLSDCTVDFEQPPHSWVINSVGGLVVRAAEQACIEA